MSARSGVAKAFGKVLKLQRKAKGMSQEDLAAECELDRTYPSLLERGLRTPTITVLFQIAKALNVKAERLVDETLKELNKT